jgi:simple sugar transport system substrate-binding protein
MSHAEQDQQDPGLLDQLARPGFDRRAFLRRTALGGMAVGGVSTLLSACGSSASSGGAASSVFGSASTYKFVFVSPTTANPFFIPTQYGAADACKLLGCSYKWTGSGGNNVSQMVSAVNSAVAEKADGIAVALIDNEAFNGPVEAALRAGIPVVAFNADAVGNKRLAYIGQELEAAGELMGERIVRGVPSGDVALITSAPGVSNATPRITGVLHREVRADRKEGKSITIHPAATGAANGQEAATAIEGFWRQEGGIFKGMYAVDGVSTEGLGKAMKNLGLAAKGVKAGGFDLVGETPRLVQEGNLEFAIDSQPYLQGFLPVQQLFLWHDSGSLTGPAETDTGAKFVEKDTVAPYVEHTSRYEGTSAEVKVIPIKAGTPA